MNSKAKLGLGLVVLAGVGVGAVASVLIKRNRVEELVEVKEEIIDYKLMLSENENIEDIFNIDLTFDDSSSVTTELENNFVIFENENDKIELVYLLNPKNGEIYSETKQLHIPLNKIPEFYAEYFRVFKPSKDFGALPEIITLDSRRKLEEELSEEDFTEPDKLNLEELQEKFKKVLTTTAFVYKIAKPLIKKKFTK